MGVSIWVGNNSDRVAAALEIIAKAHAKDIQDITSWATMQSIVNSGAGPMFFPVGTQITDEWTQTASGTAVTAPWDVVNHDNTGMTLNWHYAFPDTVQFDAPEAIWYADANGLAAGTYHIAIGSSYGSGWVTSKAIQFTLSDALVAGDQIVIGELINNNTDPTDGKTISIYAKGAAEAKQTATTSNGTDGTLLGTIGPESAQKPNGQFNAISRVVYGSGRWSQSAIRQYLNSSADAGAWWAAQNDWDRPPTQATTLRGFLAGCSSDFLSVLQPSAVVTDLNTVEGYTTTTETTYDKIFLPSRFEMREAAGDSWEYYDKLAAQLGVNYFGSGAANAHDELKKYNLTSQSSSVNVWLRSPGTAGAYGAWYVTSGGYFNSYTAYLAYRGCPACKIQIMS